MFCGLRCWDAEFLCSLVYVVLVFCSHVNDRLR